MSSEGRENDSSIPRCWECGHSDGVHYPATNGSPNGGCNGPYYANWAESFSTSGAVGCECEGYRDNDDQMALWAVPKKPK
jgi:hypothetical protein